MLWLVTPVHGRKALTRLCFEQRARMLAELAELGVEARQLVVGDDGNIDTAREFGFDVLRRDNIVGWRVNEGFEWAVREGGATHVVYLGSDDWHLADFFTKAPDDAVLTCRWQAFVPPAGNRLVVINQTAPVGGGPWVIPLALLAPCGYRPADDTAMRAVDASIANSVFRSADERAELPRAPKERLKARRAARRAAFVFDEEADQLRLVDFKAGAEQITTWERVVGVKRPRAFESSEPFVELARVYPADLVERMQRFYAEKEAR